MSLCEITILDICLESAGKFREEVEFPKETYSSEAEISDLVQAAPRN